MPRKFKLLVATAEDQSEEFTQIVAVIDGVCWELDSTLSNINKDAHGYRRLAGGFQKVSPDYPSLLSARSYLDRALDARREVEDTVGFNDARGRTFEEVRGVIGEARSLALKDGV